MYNIFISVLNMSITASCVIAVVLLVRLLLKKLPKKYSYLLWSVVGFRLAFPFSFKSALSLFSLDLFDMNSAQAVNYNAMNYIPYYSKSSVPNTDIGIYPTQWNTVNQAANGINGTVDKVTGFHSEITACIWLAVMVIALLWGVISYITLKAKMSTAVLYEENVYESDKVNSPFILGFFSPKIYIPFNLDDKTYQYVLAHEKCHLKRYDYYIKAFAFVLLCIHWFNPLCWLAFYLVTKDMEMSCDEKVLAENEGIRKEYGNALLSFATNGKYGKVTPLCFGENSVESRIKNVLNFKKPKMIISITAVALCLVIVIACAANPKTDEQNDTVNISSSDIETLVSAAIADNEKDKYYKGSGQNYFGESHRIYDIQNGDLNGKNTDKYITVFAHAVIVNLAEKNTILVENSAASHPCAIVFAKDKDGYIFNEYWTPRDGEAYGKDLEKIFSSKALKKYKDLYERDNETIAVMQNEAYANCIDNNNLDINKYIKNAFESFDNSGPKHSSNPYDYMRQDSEEYKFLMDFSQCTIRYVYTEFLKGGQTDIYGKFYQIALEQIVGGEALKLHAETGQDYFDAFLAHNQNLLELNDAEFMKKYYPYGYLLLQMNGDIPEE